MVKYDLQCDKGHGFEGWFDSISAYDEQAEKGLLRCPLCDSPKVTKALMAPNIPAKSNTRSETAPVAQSSAELEAVAEVRQAVQKLRDHVEANSDYVGKDFADEARKIHYGETEDRSIYGETSLDEAKDLIEEGIDVLPLPEVEKSN